MERIFSSIFISNLKVLHTSWNIIKKNKQSSAPSISFGPHWQHSSLGVVVVPGQSTSLVQNMKFCMDIHWPQGMNPTDSGNTLTFPLFSPWIWHLWFWIKCLLLVLMKTSKSFFSYVAAALFSAMISPSHKSILTLSFTMFLCSTCSKGRYSIFSEGWLGPYSPS